MPYFDILGDYFQSRHHKLTFTNFCVVTIFKKIQTFDDTVKAFRTYNLNHRKQPMEQAKSFLAKNGLSVKAILIMVFDHQG